MPRKRPLSPHLTVYRPQLTSVLSIMHRGSGVLLALGSALLVYWFYALAAGPEQYAAVQAWYGSALGRIVLLLWTVCLFYHLANGIRHLAWDAGYGFDLRTLYRSGWSVVVVTVLLTLIVWWIAYQFKGGA